MKTSLFTTLDAHPAARSELVDRYGSFLRHVVLAEELGFDSCWVGEHHYCAVGSVPNPAVLLAAAAARTQRIRLGPAICVLPLRRAVLVAEEYAMLDVLTQGRLNMGVGTGSQPFEFESMGVDFERRRSIFERRLAELVAAWTRPPGDRPPVLNVPTVQNPPPIYVATMTPQGAYRAGRAGHSVLTLVTPTVQSLDDVRARIDAHARGSQEHGSAGATEAVVTFFACAGHSEDEALDRAANSMQRFVELSSGSRPEKPRELCESMRERKTALFGTEARVREQLDDIEALGCEHACLFADFGTMDPHDVALTMRCLAPSPTTGIHPRRDAP